jgi:hypothetical protein
MISQTIGKYKLLRPTGSRSVVYKGGIYHLYDADDETAELLELRADDNEGKTIVPEMMFTYRSRELELLIDNLFPLKYPEKLYDCSAIWLGDVLYKNSLNRLIGSMRHMVNFLRSAQQWTYKEKYRDGFYDLMDQKGLSPTEASRGLHDIYEYTIEQHTIEMGLTRYRDKKAGKAGPDEKTTRQPSEIKKAKAAKPKNPRQPK